MIAGTLQAIREAGVSHRIEDTFQIIPDAVRSTVFVAKQQAIRLSLNCFVVRIAGVTKPHPEIEFFVEPGACRHIAIARRALRFADAFVEHLRFLACLVDAKNPAFDIIQSLYEQLLRTN